MKLALLGATGAVGRTMLQVLAERGTPVDELVPLASARSVGATISWRGRDWRVEEPRASSFEGCSVALFSAGAQRSRDWAHAAADAGAIVVDNSSAWRMDPRVPLVVPEVNPQAADARPLGIIANPNCATIQMVLPLEALRRAAGLRRVIACTYQSVSGAGQKGLAALEAEAAGGSAEDSPFPERIFGNAIPRIGPEADGGWTEEEEKIRNETRKILSLPELRVSATCVRVPVPVGHGVAVAAELDSALSAAQVRDAFARMPGVRVVEHGRDPLPRDAAGQDQAMVGRIRIDRDDPAVIHFWVVADNLRKGAATNAVQIAEMVRA